MATSYGKKPKIIERFADSQLNSNVWGVFGTSYGSITVNSNNECEIRNASGGSSDRIGIYSQLTFPVGMSLTVRSKNTSGRHSSLVGFGESVWQPFPHGRSSIGCTWYSREDNVSSTIGSSFDENGNASSGGDAGTQDLRSYQVFRLERVSSSEVRFYRNEILEYTLTGVKFENNYSVYFSADGWSNSNRGGLDNVIVIDYVVVA